MLDVTPAEGVRYPVEKRDVQDKIKDTPSGERPVLEL